MKIVTVEQMRRLEQQADASGLSYTQMMETAGRAVAAVVAQKREALQTTARVEPIHILVLVGPGNNGGDGLVAARYLHDEGLQVALYLWNRKTDNDANFALTQERRIPATHADNDADFSTLRALLDKSDIIVDALLGTGANRPITGVLQGILLTVKVAVEKSPIPSPAQASQLRRASFVSSSPKLQSLTPNLQVPSTKYQVPKIVIAVDLPSGVNADTGATDAATVRADVTVTFAYPKVGFFKFPAADMLGELIVADIGISSTLANEVSLHLATAELVRAWLPARPRVGHKGTFGKALIVSGAASYTGAPYLCAAAAARVGVGIATLATTPEAQHIVATTLHEPTYLLLKAEAGAIAAEASEQIAQRIAEYDALLVGPGLGRAATTQQFIERLFSAQTPLPSLVIDADGLNALSAWSDWTDHVPVNSVLTPHIGEFARLTQLSSTDILANREAVARTFAMQWKQIVLLKGAFTCIAEPNGQVTLLPFANPALATAGSGDVLAGIIVGLLAQGVASRAAAIAGGYIHGLCGELVRDELGDAGALAGDLLPRIPQALRRIKSDQKISGFSQKSDA
jgi:NAD(P)H-hydrate epimerase